MAAAKKKAKQKPKPAAKAKPAPRKPVKPASKKKGPAPKPTKPLAPKGTAEERAELAAATETTTFLARVATAYQKASWDGRGPGGVQTTAEVGPVSAQVPASWGAPHVGGGALTWELGDASVRLFAGARPASPPTLDQWAAMRAQVLPADWQIVGSRKLEHPSGAPALETAELTAGVSKSVRVVRALFAAPVFCTFAITAPGPIPDARGKELGAAFKTLRVLTVP
jgi:hypothetical protein